MKLFEGVDDRGRVVHQSVPLHQSREHYNHCDIEQCTGNERGDDADGQVALRILTLLCSGGDGIESNVGEKDDRSASKDSRPAVRRKGMVVRWMDEFGCKSHE